MRGGELVDLFFVDPDCTNPTATRNGVTRHRTHYEHQPFVTFAGPWAEATWLVENDSQIVDLDEALENAWGWDENAADPYSDAARYELRFADLANATGYPAGGQQWEIAWMEELEQLWPVICEVADLMLVGHVNLGMVRAALDGTHQEASPPLGTKQRERAADLLPTGGGAG